VEGLIMRLKFGLIWEKAKGRTLSLYYVIALFTLFSLFSLSSPSFVLGEDSDDKAESLPESVSIYTATGGTTAVLPLLVSLSDGWPHTKTEVVEWKNLDDLRGLLLAGKGDVWVGHLETFARAASRGAPVRLLSVTAWKKFYFVSTPLLIDPGKAPRLPRDLSELSAYLNKNKLALPAAPQNSPAEGVLKLIESSGGPGFKVSGYSGQQLILELVAGKIHSALLPEPLVTNALLKNPNLAIIGSLEEKLALVNGGQARLPHAGIAVNRNFASSYPNLTRELAQHLKAAGNKLRNLRAAQVVDLLPKTTRDALGEDALEQSLSRDPIIVESAEDVAPEVDRFICLTASDLCSDNYLKADFPSDFIF
jgi:NitT/TauT family transport system substrate-binding protein